MNWWIWIILLWCFCGKNDCGNHCMCDCYCNRDLDCNRDRDRDCDCDSDSRRQPRGFVGFGDNATCGCEEKDS